MTLLIDYAYFLITINCMNLPILNISNNNLILIMEHIQNKFILHVLCITYRYYKKCFDHQSQMQIKLKLKQFNLLYTRSS